MTECSKCSGEFTPTPSQVARWSKVCKACDRKRNQRQYAARKAAGLKVSGPRASKEYHSQYNKSYSLREDVKQRRRERAKARAKDPAEAPKIAARRLVRTAIESGKITRRPCEFCGVSPADAHHDDYGKPLEVRWLCRTHHIEHHSKATEVQS